MPDSLKSVRNRFASYMVSLFSKKIEFQELILKFERDINQAENSLAVLGLLRGTFEQLFSPLRLHIFIFDPESHCYRAAPDLDGKLTSDLRFDATNPLIEVLTRTTNPLDLSQPSIFPESLKEELPHLAILGPGLIFPISSRQHLSGWVIACPGSNTQTFTPLESHQISFLCNLSAAQIAQIEVAVQTKKRDREIDILVEVSKGINITTGFDDAFELVYTLVNQAIPTRDFQIMLLDKNNGTGSYVFYLENDRRCSEIENRPLPIDSGLEDEIISNQNPIRLTDYQQACRQRGLIPVSTDIYAWIGVPLNAGSETIGVMEIASRNVAEVFSVDQLNFLQAIGDQIAGAIVKNRLLQETGQHARQLGLLNEAARQFSSIFELQPLMATILKFGLELVNCKSALIALPIASTGQMIIRAVAGSVSADLVGTPLPAQVSLVPPALDSQTSATHLGEVIADWGIGADNKQALMAPLSVNEKVIGLVALFDRVDNLLSTDRELSILAIYASQAAIALEMTQSYIKTDLALADRVEELSVMQQIDRELNTSLDIEKAMRITLEWAMRQSKANAGLIGLVEPAGIQVMSSQGYADELDLYLNGVIPPEKLPSDAVLRDNSPAYLYDFFQETPQTGLLRGCQSQAIIPIRRESNVIGLILLESNRPEFWSPDDLVFLSRLSDHASVAIFNAQLYHVVLDANNAKSEFVSFVAHELKNPMTSIKGYTELLAAGAVGPVTSPQSNFLTTIRSNIDRMNTLISDLNDISKIEAGRVRLEFTSFNLSEVVDEAVRSARRQIEEKKQSLAIEIPADLPFVWADRTRLIQILVNLISNANKYTPEDGQIAVFAAPIEPGEDNSGTANSIHLWVQDNGIGISSEDQKRIFRKFFRSEDPKTRETSGTGLGLSISRSLVEMQGGRIWFESKFRQGTTFHISIPVAS